MLDAIRWRYLAIAGASGATAELMSWSLGTHTWSQSLLWCTFWLLLWVAAVWDLCCMRIPNWLTLPGALVLFVLGLTLARQGPVRPLLGLAVCAGGLSLLAWLTGGVGWGDVKLALSIGAVFGPVLGMVALTLAFSTAALCGGLLWGLGRLRAGQPFPFAPFLLAGCGLCFRLVPHLLPLYIPLASLGGTLWA
ncbi:prepilin peptidase [Alicyclobacillus shizuokensis]|uniref:prepilin peptidase n=1 Tax=Alicyclobacillus shizuokensis TaxID=392014 RepID=UPI00083643D1|nr:A24 family peptidase [Alicyclobacillus shizuokensis]MCL6627005.1 A24 family peptidase [Alicyclobacillus shizuokensis]